MNERIEHIFELIRSKLIEASKATDEKNPLPWDEQHAEALKKAQGQPTFRWGKSKVPKEYYETKFKPKKGEMRTSALKFKVKRNK